MWLFLLFVFVPVLALVIRYKIQRIKERRRECTQALLERDEAAASFVKLGLIIDDPAVTKEQRHSYAVLKHEFEPMTFVTKLALKPTWSEVSFRSRTCKSKCDKLLVRVEERIHYVRQAEMHCPGLLRELPGLFLRVRAKMARGSCAPNARRRLADAEQWYNETLDKKVAMAETVCWPDLYPAFSYVHEILTQLDTQCDALNLEEQQQPEVILESLPTNRIASLATVSSNGHIHEQ